MPHLTRAKPHAVPAQPNDGACGDQQEGGLKTELFREHQRRGGQRAQEAETTRSERPADAPDALPCEVQRHRDRDEAESRAHHLR